MSATCQEATSTAFRLSRRRLRSGGHILPPVSLVTVLKWAVWGADMLQGLRGRDQHQLSTAANWTELWVGSIGIAVAVGVAYFLAARLSLFLLTKPDGVAVFWPAAGVSSGVLIALGRDARWPVAVGTIVATLVANLTGDRNVWSAFAFALCNAG